jgi:hypothetical protein
MQSAVNMGYPRVPTIYRSSASRVVALCIAKIVVIMNPSSASLTDLTNVILVVNAPSATPSWWSITRVSNTTLLAPSPKTVYALSVEPWCIPKVRIGTRGTMYPSFVLGVTVIVSDITWSISHSERYYYAKERNSSFYHQPLRMREQIIWGGCSILSPPPSEKKF